jgi:tRNA(Ile)-lysidine synthase
MNTDVFSKKIKDLKTELNNFSLKTNEIVVGFSGGADSTALILILNDILNKTEITLSAVHFQHNLRGEESKEDENWCISFAENLGIDLKIVDLNISQNQLGGEGTEAAARRLRNDYWCSNYPNTIIALAHHIDDKIENFFIRAFRGSNTSGLSSLKKIQEIGNATFYRPLISWSKKEIVSYLENRGADWRTDSTNLENKYSRNILRNSILPQIYESFHYSYKGILQSISTVKEDADFIDSEAAKTYEKINKEKIEIEELLNLHSAIFVRVMRRWLSDALNEEFIPTKSFIERVKTELSQHKSSTEPIFLPLKGKTQLLIHKGKLELYVPTEQQEIVWDITTNNEITFLNYQFELINKEDVVKYSKDKILHIPEDTAIITIRNKRAGDRIKLSAEREPTKLKKIFSRKKISSIESSKLPILTIANEVIWVPGITQSYQPTQSNKAIRYSIISK